MLELAILGVLAGQELHGYEIRKRLRDELGVMANVSFGSLYPALSRLERAGAVQAIDEPATATAAVPMTGSLGGERAVLRGRRTASARSRRGRKVYRITDDGRRLFAELLDGGRAVAAPDDARSFGLRLAFARHLAPQARLRLLERRRAQLTQRLTEALAAAAASERLDPYARSLVEHARESLERDVAWLDRLIETERSSNLPGGAARAPRASEGPDAAGDPRTDRSKQGASR